MIVQYLYGDCIIILYNHIQLSYMAIWQTVWYSGPGVNGRFIIVYLQKLGLEASNVRFSNLYIGRLGFLGMKHEDFYHQQMGFDMV